MSNKNLNEFIHIPGKNDAEYIKFLEKALEHQKILTSKVAAEIKELMDRQNEKVVWIKEDRGGIEYTAVCPKCGYDTYFSDVPYFNHCPGCGVAISKKKEE